MDFYWVFVVTRDIANMEADRSGAMKSGDALRYHILCVELNYGQHAIEDIELFLRGKSLKEETNIGGDMENIEIISLDEVEDDVILSAYRIVRPIINNPDWRKEGYAAELKKRLRMIKATGYPLESHGSSDNLEVIVSAYTNTKGTILQQVLRRGLKYKK